MEKRNIERFPEEFMFQLTTEEFEILKSQIVISSWGGTRKMPFAFAELWSSHAFQRTSK
ncbi:MAG: ORF6N domain-containing protein [Bacteroidota bacterium]